MSNDRRKRHKAFPVLPALFSIAVLFSILSAGPAAAQVVALVNGDPITAVDVSFRMKLNEITTHKKMSKQEALDELVIEKIKLQTAKQKGIEIPDSQIDRTLTGMAQRVGRKLPEFIESMTKSGIDVPRFKTKIRTEYAWRQVLEQRSPGMFQVRDADMVAILTARGEQPQTTATQYSLQPIIFVVARRSPDTVKAARLKEAEALRARSTSCEESVTAAREMREVVVKDPIIKNSTDLGAQYRKLLDDTPDGKMTPPEVTSMGIEVVAVCSRKSVIADISSSRREFREELLTRRVGELEKSYIEQLRKQSIIEYR